MRIEFLGRGRVVDSDGNELLRSGIPLAFLAYLHAASPPVGRDHLAMRFWPGRSPGSPVP
jgi:DNA-binding SARP family transcriptional activator